MFCAKHIKEAREPRGKLRQTESDPQPHVVEPEALRHGSVEATAALSTNLAAIERIAAHLSDMAERTNETPAKVGHLNERTSQIGGILQLIKEIADQRQPAGARRGDRGGPCR